MSAQRKDVIDGSARLGHTGAVLEEVCRRLSGEDDRNEYGVELARIVLACRY